MCGRPVLLNSAPCEFRRCTSIRARNFAKECDVESRQPHPKHLASLFLPSRKRNGRSSRPSGRGPSGRLWSWAVDFPVERRRSWKSPPGGRIACRCDYTAIDQFESRGESQPRLSLKEAFHVLRPTGVKLQLVPGDPLSALSRIANSLAGTDLLLIAADQDRQSLAQAWKYVPRMLAPGAHSLARAWNRRQKRNLANDPARGDRPPGRCRFEDAAPRGVAADRKIDDWKMREAAPRPSLRTSCFPSSCQSFSCQLRSASQLTPV